MKSTCPECGAQNDSHENRLKRFRLSQVFGFYLPGLSQHSKDFKTIVCGNCDTAYEESEITLFGLSASFEWIVPLGIFMLFLYMAAMN